MRRVFVLSLVLCVGAVACGGDGSEADEKRSAPKRTTSTTLSPPTTYPPVDPATYGVPAVIDEAYIEHVLAGLDHEQGNALRILVKSKNTDDEAWQRKMQSITTDTQFDLETNLGNANIKAGFPRLRSVPGDPVTTVQEVVQMDSGCFFAAVGVDYSGLVRAPEVRDKQRYIALVPKINEGFGSENPTPWVMALNGYTADGSRPENPCAG